MTAPQFARGQATAARRLGHTLTITRPGTPDDNAIPELDPDTLAPIAAEDVAVWTGPCNVVAVSETRGQRGGQDELLATHVVMVPLNAYPVLPGDVAQITAVADGADPQLLGTRYIVRSSRPGTVLRRIMAVEVQRAVTVR